MSMRIAKRLPLAKNEEKVGTSNEKIEIPKIIHFIWAGGAVRMPDKNLGVVLKWAVKNPDWKIFIWTDVESDPAVITNNFYRKRLERFLQVEDEFNELNAQQKELLMRGIFVQDISCFDLNTLVLGHSTSTTATSSSSSSTSQSGNIVNFRDEYVAYEIGKLTPDYGASSDLLRYTILYRIGGAYFDTDVLPSMIGLSQIPLSQLPMPVLYIDHCSQSRNAPISRLNNFTNLNNIGNDSLISTRNNPTTFQLCSIARINYDNKDDISAVIKAYGGKNFFTTTINKTGPGVIREILSRSQFKDDHYELDGTQILRVRDGRICLSIPDEKNQGQWLKARIDFKSFDEAIGSVYRTIEFEIHHYGAIRIDDHISDILASCRDETKKTSAINVVLSICRRYLENNPNIRDGNLIVQVTGRFPETRAFFVNNRNFRCKTLFDLSPQHLELALQTLLDPWFLTPALSHDTLHGLEDKIFTCVSILQENLKFIIGINSCLEQFTSEAREIAIKYLNHTLDRYAGLINLLSNHGVEIADLNPLKRQIDSCMAELRNLNYTAVAAPSGAVTPRR